MVAFLYFFSYFFAPDAPIINFLHQNVSFAFGDVGTFPFFVVAGVTGLLILRRGQMMRTWFKVFFTVVMLLSALLNFPVLSNVESTYQSNGGYVSWPLLWLIKQLFGDSVAATKILIVLLTLMALVWI